MTAAIAYNSGRALQRAGDNPMGGTVPTRRDDRRDFLYKQIARARQSGESGLVDHLLDRLLALREADPLTEQAVGK